jgi:hypothetical protein
MTDRYAELVNGNVRGQKAEEGLQLLREARECFKASGSTDTLKRVRLAISSAQGAVRHASLHPVRQLEREIRAGQEDGAA